MSNSSIKKRSKKIRYSNRIRGIKIYKDGMGNEKMNGGAEESKKSQPEIRRNDRAIVTAADRGDLTDVMRLYQDYNVSLESTDDIHYTALMRASGEGHFSIVEFLVANGAGLDGRSRSGWTAMHIAAVWGREKILRYLIDAGADMNIRDVRGGTPLMNAVANDHRGCVARLLMEGADDTIVDNYGETALDWAVSRNRPYADVEFWEGMKARVSESKINTFLRSAAILAENNSLESGPLKDFIVKVPESMIMMEQIMSNLIPKETDPRILDRHSEEYESFATGVLRAFSSLPEGVENKPFDFFMSFVNAGRSEPFTKQRAKALMKVLAGDGCHGFGFTLSEEVNPARLTLETLRYDEERELVSLKPPNNQPLNDGKKKSVKRKKSVS